MIGLNVVNSGNLEQAAPLLSPTPAPPSIPENITPAAQNVTPSFSWHQKAINKLDEWDKSYVSKIPHLLGKKIAGKIDNTAEGVISFYKEGFRDFNAWLDEKEFKETYNNAFKELTVFLIKLPLRVMRNIINMIFSILKAAVFSAMHPARAAIKLTKLIINLLNELTKPAVWTKMGAGMVGASLGQAAVGNPLSPLGIIIGLALMCGGLAAGAIKEAIKNKEDKLQHIKRELVDQLRAIPESFLTGFLIGLIFGAVQADQRDVNKLDNHVRSMARGNEAIYEPKKFALEYCKEHNLRFHGLKWVEVQTDGPIVVKFTSYTTRYGWDPHMGRDGGMGWVTDTITEHSIDVSYSIPLVHHPIVTAGAVPTAAGVMLVKA